MQTAILLFCGSVGRYHSFVFRCTAGQLPTRSITTTKLTRVTAERYCLWPKYVSLGLLWLDTEQEQKMLERRIPKFYCPWLLGTLSAADSLCHALTPLMMQISKRMIYTLLSFSDAHLARVLRDFFNLKLELPLGSKQRLLYTVFWNMKQATFLMSWTGAFTRNPLKGL